MTPDMLNVVRWVQSTMGEAHRGLLPHRGRLVAFGNRGTAEVAAFSEWLKQAGYERAAYAAEDGSWAMVITPPAWMRDTRSVRQALWDASPDCPARKDFQMHIADSQIRSLFASLGTEVAGNWFTRAQVSKLGLAQPNTTPEHAARAAASHEPSLD